MHLDHDFPHAGDLGDHFAERVDNFGDNGAVLALGHHPHQRFGAAFADQHAAVAVQPSLSITDRRLYPAFPQG